MTAGLDWFKQITGFDERAYDETRQRLFIADGRLISRESEHAFAVGQLETPTLGDLRSRASPAARDLRGSPRVSTVVGDVRQLHADPTNAHALFQVASQFNLLEMTGPSVRPEDGVTRYATDRTQGPACAIAAGAATIYRNYFVPVGGGVGQTETRQIDCLDRIGVALNNSGNRLWTMRNGYAMCSEEATLLSGIVNWARTGSRVVYLTRLGGGAFGNEPAWIDAAIARALSIVEDVALDVRLVSRPS